MARGARRAPGAIRWSVEEAGALDAVVGKDAHTVVCSGADRNFEIQMAGAAQLAHGPADSLIDDVTVAVQTVDEDAHVDEAVGRLVLHIALDDAVATMVGHVPGHAEQTLPAEVERLQLASGEGPG